MITLTLDERQARLVRGALVERAGRELLGLDFIRREAARTNKPDLARYADDSEARGRELERIAASLLPSGVRRWRSCS